MPDDGRLPDDVVADLRPLEGGAVAPIEDLTLLVGYLGDGPPVGGDPTHRIYADALLTEFVQVPAADVVRREKLDEEGEYIARSAVWVRTSALETEIDYPPGVEEALAAAGVAKHLPIDALGAAFDMTLVALKITTKYCPKLEEPIAAAK